MMHANTDTMSRKRLQEEGGVGDVDNYGNNKGRSESGSKIPLLQVQILSCFSHLNG